MSRTQKKAYSSELNIPKESPVGYRAIGAKLEQRPDLLDKLYPLLGIAIRPVWDQSVPFLVAVNREAQRMELETASAVQAGLDSGVPFAAPTMPDMEDADG